MKTAYTLLVFALLSVLVCSQTTCPLNCAGCDNITSCNICQQGFYLVNRTYCAPCPPLCTSCNTTLNGTVPFCMYCAQNAALNPLTHLCLTCHISCQTCSQYFFNCLTCKPGLILKQIDLSQPNNFSTLVPANTTGTINICIQDSNCLINNCLQCVPADTFAINRCVRCKDGYFLSFNGCYPCKYSCKNCGLNLVALWPTIEGFWNVTILGAFNVTPGSPIPPGVLPSFLMDLNWTALGENGIIIGFSLFVGLTAIQPITTALNLTASQIVLEVLNFVPTLANLTTEQEITGAILAKINSVTRRNFTLSEIIQRFNQVIASLTVCIECSLGFQFSNPPSSICSSCPSNCLSCSGGLCQVCQRGYFESTGSCSPCTPPCASCQTTGSTCTSCLPPMSLSSTSTCILCQQPCLTCSSSDLSICITCKKPYSVQATSAGVCYRCTQDLCLKCTEANTSICQICKPGSVLNSQSQICELCPPNCLSCNPKIVIGNITIPSICLQCQPGLALTSNGCSRCGLGCINCSPTNSSNCLQCITGTYLNSSLGICQKCRQGCLECTGLQTCTSFANGIIIIGDAIVSCRPGCKVCDPTSPHICLTCQDRFYLDSSNCKICQPGCSRCTDDTTCLSCFPGLEFSNGDCLKCQGNCLTCNPANLTSCLTCIRGFTLVGTQCKFQCATGCLQCDGTNSSKCIKCKQGHGLKQTGECIKCLSGCSGSCDPKNISICLGCTNGFQLKQNACVRCSPGCVSCLNGACLTCAQQFTLYQDSTGKLLCKQKCLTPCSECVGNTCFKCQTGFTLSNNVCTPDLSCNPNCEFCPIGTQKSPDNQCVACPEKCASCGDGVCFQCNEGLYLDGTQCLACPQQCKTCYSSQLCSICAQGYVKKIIAMQTGVQDATYSDQCIACDPNCKTCIVQPIRCTSCFQGFRLYSSRCAGLYTVVYVYQLAIAYATFLADSKSQSFIETISQMVQVSSLDNYVEFIREGSTNVGGTISANSQSGASGIQSSLGNSVPGYTVLSSSASVYYGDQPYTPPKQQTNNNQYIGIIVGCVIGGVVLIAIVVFIVYKLKARSVPINQESNSGQYLPAQSTNIVKE